ERLAKAEVWFKRYGVLAIIFGRHIPGFRIPITVACGAFRIPYPVFAPSPAASISISAATDRSFRVNSRATPQARPRPNTSPPAARWMPTAPPRTCHHGSAAGRCVAWQPWRDVPVQLERRLDAVMAEPLRDCLYIRAIL